MRNEKIMADSNSQRSKERPRKMILTSVQRFISAASRLPRIVIAFGVNISLTFAVIVPVANSVLALRVNRFQSQIIIAAMIFVTMAIINWVLSTIDHSAS